jgi:transposase
MTDVSTAVSLEIFVGVDTHKDTHHAAIIDHLGRPVADHQFDATPAGYRKLLSFITDAGVIASVGIEGTGTYGAGLTRVLTEAGLPVVEVDKPDRRARRARGKSDPVDAYAAATAALSGRATTIPKTRDGDSEALRFLSRTRALAVKARAEALTALRSMIVAAPEPLRGQLRHLTRTDLIGTCAGLRPDPVAAGGILAATKTALRSTARRITALSEEINALDTDLAVLTRRAAPALLAAPGIGIVTAAELLICVGDNPDRLRSEAAFATSCGVAPLPASSGKICRHRLNRGGNRQANRALHTIVISRLKTDTRTRDYMARRTEEGKTKREIIRCLKRYVAREIYRVLHPTQVDSS